MSLRPRIVRLTRAEIAALNRPENEHLQEAYGDGLSLLHDLVSRYSGSWFSVVFPEKEHAFRLLGQALDQLGDEGVFREKMDANVNAFHLVERWFDDGGGTEELRRAAQGLMDDLAEELDAIYTNSAGEIAGNAVRRRAAG